MASRRRTSPKPDPLDLDRELDEMYSSAITRPNLGFLRVSPSPPFVSEISPFTDTVSTDHSAIDKASMDSRSIDKSVFPTECDSVSSEATSLDRESSVPVSMDAPPVGKWKLHRCSTVQDGHSANEQLLYEMLWRAATELNPDERLISISREDMASQSRITVRNIKGVLGRLVEKLAVERVLEPNSFVRRAAAYKVYSYRLILERRRRSGMEWVTRANGVRFIPSHLAEEIQQRPKFAGQDHRQPSGTIDLTTHVNTTPDRASPDVRSMDSTSMIVNILGLELRRMNPAFDSAAVLKLWQTCRTLVSDCTVEEVIHFSRLRMQELRSSQNGIQMFFLSLDQFFDPTSIQAFRQTEI